MRRLKRALSSVLVVVMVIGLFPPRLGARGVDERGESNTATLHHDGGGTPSDVNTVFIRPHFEPVDASVVSSLTGAGPMQNPPIYEGYNDPEDW